MADVKKYYYMKLKEDFFDSSEIRILESMPNGLEYSNILLKLYLKSLKHNGTLMLNDLIPYDVNMIATITNMNIDVVKSALVKFKELALIEQLDNGAIYMTEIQNYIGKSSTDGDRKRIERQLSSNKALIGGQMSDKCPPEIELEIEIEKDINNKSKEKKKTIKQYINSLTISDNLKTALNDFADMRITIKKPLSLKAMELTYAKLISLSGDEQEQIAIINQSIEHSWQGLFQLGGDSNGINRTSKNNQANANKSRQDGTGSNKDSFGNELL